jgi:hypothetical protein
LEKIAADLRRVAPGEMERTARNVESNEWLAAARRLIAETV